MGHSASANETSFQNALGALRKSRMRVTEPRQALLRVMIGEHGPFTIEELHQRVQKETCDLVTVYRCLEKLERAGLVRRCDFGDGCIRYEFREDGQGHTHHHHIICRTCRRVETLDICVMEEVERLVRERGYADVEHSLEFFGLCPACQKPRHGQKSEV